MGSHKADQLSPSSVKGSFGFDFGTLGAKDAKQSSLPAQRPARRTPNITTPRGTPGSAQRHRSASIQRRSGIRRRSTPNSRHQTPQLGKRKRDSVSAQPGGDEEELDELSPDRHENVLSIEKSQKHFRVLSPNRKSLHEEPDELSVLHEAPDELSILEDSEARHPKEFKDSLSVNYSTPALRTANKRTSLGNAVQKTPHAFASKAISVSSRRSIPRTSKSKDVGTVAPDTPGSAILVATLATPAIASANEDSEDELSPSHTNGLAPRVEQQDRYAQGEVEPDADELSSPLQPTARQTTPSVTKVAADEQGTKQKGFKADATSASLTERRRPRQLGEEKDDDESATAAAPSKPLRSGRLKEANKTTKIAHRTPAYRKPGKGGPQNVPVEEDVGEDRDEISPESERTSQRMEITAGVDEDIPELSDAADSDEYEEPEPQELTDSIHRPSIKHHSPKRAPTSGFPSRKRQKFTGPKRAISVMRIKGSTVRGITIADTARTIMEETINHRLTRMAEKVQTSQDSDRRKELRSCINLTLSFKESLDEKLLDLQDANDVLTTGFKKIKLFKRDNARLRKEILTLQNNRQDIALEHDDVQAEFDAEKSRVEARNTLSVNLYDIEAAIRKGREKARTEGREDEGPEIPLSMMIDDVGRDIGSSGGGLLDHVKGFNGLLERAAGWLEGRA